MKRLLPIVMISLGLSLSNTTLARPHHGGPHYHHGHRSHTSIGLSFGYSAFYPPYPAYTPGYYYPYYPYWQTPVTVVQTQPVVVSQPVIQAEQNTANTQNNADNYWYYCSQPKGYYPYVLKCSVAWQKVIPHPVDTPKKEKK